MVLEYTIDYLRQRGKRVFFDAEHFFDAYRESGSYALDCLENAQTLVPKLKLDALLLVGGQSRMPKIKQRLREVFGDIIYDQILPEEAVAIGAAIYGNVQKALQKKKAQQS